MRFYRRRFNYRRKYRSRYPSSRKYLKPRVRTRVVYRTDYYKLKGLKRRISSLRRQLQKEKKLSGLFASELGVADQEIGAIGAPMYDEPAGPHFTEEELLGKRPRLSPEEEAGL